MVVPDTATQVSVGVRMVSAGTLWVDDVEATVREVDGTARMSDAAKTYLDEAVAKVQGEAMNSNKLNWPRVLAQAYALAQDAATATDTHDAIRFVLRSLGDGHSHFIAPNTAKQTQSNSNTENFNLASATIAGKGYVSVPAYIGNLSARQTAFVDAIQSNIKARAADKVCGWIVDLRENTGGSMHPMLAGLAPLFGDGALGSLVSPNGTKQWRVANGGSGFGEAADTSNDARATRPLILDGAIAAPVAVLLGPKTASSGEIVAVSFVGRPNTRSFGEPTRGQTTGNSSIELTDGAVMAVTTSIYADRNGKRYGGKVTPDEPLTPVSRAATTLQDDALIEAAIKWLDKQLACQN
jgi:C-terminal processing protease CtpA/Prc